MDKSISCNLTRSVFYVCPRCGNVVHSAFEGEFCCCGEKVSPLTAAACDEAHLPHLEAVEDETYVTIPHDMTKAHYISFLCYVTGDRMELIKLYPEGNAEARFHMRGHGFLYLYCTKHGLMKITV